MKKEDKFMEIVRFMPRTIEAMRQIDYPINEVFAAETKKRGFL